MAVDDGNTDGKATLAELRVMLVEARLADDAERIHVAVIEVVERLVDRVEEQEKAIHLLLAKETKP